MNLRSISALALVSILLPAGALAETITVTPTVWTKDTTVKVSGAHLQGGYFGLKRLCLADETSPEDYACFGQFDTDKKRWDSTDPHISKWEQNELIFTVPSKAPSKGIVILFRSDDQQKCYGSAGCLQLPDETRSDIGRFSTRPSVDSITPPPTGKLRAGTTYTIQGHLFGRDPGSISVGQMKSAASGNTYLTWSLLSPAIIESWDFDAIQITPTSDIDLTAGLKVNNGALDSDVFGAGTVKEPKSTTTSSTSRTPARRLPAGFSRTTSSTDKSQQPLAKAISPASGSPNSARPAVNQRRPSRRNAN